MKRKSMQKKRKEWREKNKLQRENPASKSWREILNKHNGGSNVTIFGTIVLKGGEK